ncbi:CLUMA_CG013098, isoform A, partial [Clunio marinus]
MFLVLFFNSLKMHLHRRKKKKRANWSRNIRNVQLEAIEGKFGFTISGQQPCILSSIIRGSPADLAGLKSGDFLISVNGYSVWQKDHEEIVALIGASQGNQIRITIADNYFSDSSDEDATANQHRFRPKYPHSKTRLNRLQLQGQSSVDIHHTVPPLPQPHPRYSHNFLSSNFLEPPPLPMFEAHNVIHSPNARGKSDIFNVSAMVSTSPINAASSLMNSPESVSFRVMVGYLGTIEMPKQIATSSKLQTVRSCIRKLRQEKRNPALVLMNILPNALNLLNSNNAILATYPANRLNYVSSSSDNNSKFFGLVTSAIHQEESLQCDTFDTITMHNVAISNSCHVFVIDTKLIDHNAHLQKAEKFNITCTKDLISNSCLEFPMNSEYICNLIRSMYSIKSPIKNENVHLGRPSAVRNLNFDAHHRRRPEHRFDDPHELLMANSPHPSNHSEITTTSSNSDSGIGFHNDYANISDRILVVDFPDLNHNRRIGLRNQNPLPYLQRQRPRPLGIVNDTQLQAINPIRNIRSMNLPLSSPQPSTSSELPVFHSKSKSADYSPSVDAVKVVHPRLAIRAMPDIEVMTKSEEKIDESDYENVYPQPVADVWYNGKLLDEAGNVVEERAIDVPDTFDTFNDNQRTMMIRSCDDIIMVMNKEEARYRRSDDQTNNETSKNEDEQSKSKDDHVFLVPANKPQKRNINKKSLTISGKMKSSHEETKPRNESNLLHYKLSPKVFGVPRPVSMSFENLSSSSKRKSLFGSRKKNKDKDQDEEMFSIWGSLQELRQSEVLKQPQHANFLEGTYSEPDLNRGNDE